MESGAWWSAIAGLVVVVLAFPGIGEAQANPVEVISRPPTRQVRVVWQVQIPVDGMRLRLYRGPTPDSLELVVESEAGPGVSLHEHLLPDVHGSALLYELRLVLPDGTEQVLRSVLALTEHLRSSATAAASGYTAPNAVQPAVPFTTPGGTVRPDWRFAVRCDGTRPPPPEPPPRAIPA